MKKLLFMLIFGIMAFSSTVFAADFYSVYQMNFEAATPSNVFIQGGECTDNSCASINGNTVSLYNGDQALACWNTFQSNSDSNQFQTCLDNAKILGNTVNTGGNNRVVTKISVPATFGSTTIFSASGDSYLVKFYRTINYQCAADICFDDQINTLNFEKKANAIAEIGQLNIVNIDDKKLPVQVTVPVSIDETVCSAFRYNNANNYRPATPAGYSDYSANTLVSLSVTQNSNGANLLSRSITVPIEADTCAGLAAFSWTPSTALEGKGVTFKVTTDVIDNQVSSSISDFAQVTEVMYPQNLTNACWTRSFDFTLSNTQSQKLTTSIAQISEGESLYALFDAVALRDETKTPMNFEARVFFDGTLVYQQLLNSGSNLKTYTVDLSSKIAGLSAGTYNVTLETQPVGLGCSISKKVTQTQNLELLVPETFNVNFYVRDPNGNPVPNANINLLLTNPDDFFQINPTYDLTQITNGVGFSGFTGAFRGTYTYTAKTPGYPAITNEIFVGSNTDIFLTLVDNNVAPVIDLPLELTGYYKDPLTLDIRDYVQDFNDAFGDLTITSQLISGNAVKNFDGQTFTFTTNQPNTAVVRIFVEDPSGEIASDDVRLNFINNEVPVVNTFVANPDNGDAPFNTIFTVNVTDAENDPLSCSIKFGDGGFTSGSCSSLNGISHTYADPGTFNAVLRVDDGQNKPFDTIEQVFVFNYTVPVPIINEFTLTSSNGGIIPTNLTFTFNVTHEKNFPTTCSLRINGVNNSIPCIGTFNVDNYNITGTGVFTLIAIDNASTQIIRQIKKDFYPSSASIENLKLDLIADDVIVPGEFKFFVSIENESIVKRLVTVKPTITCSGVVNTLNNDNGELDTSVVSKVEGQRTLYELNLDTQSFKLNVEKDKTCELSVVLTDDLGTSFKVSKNVVFSYPQEAEKLTSIRGKGTDIANYMEAFVLNSLKPGYNVASFIIENNEAESKTIVMTVISADLGINVLDEEHLGPGQEREVQIPVYIAEDTKSGIYPVRISAYDEKDKQTRYTHLRID